MIKNNLITLHIKRKQLPIFYLFFFIFLLSSGNSRLYAEENRAFNFSTLNLNNGLSQLSVLDICQDDKGYIWFATRNGLNKYDSTHFTIYKHSNRDNNSLSDNHITKLLPDNVRGGLWVGTNNGLNYLDPKTNLITNYQLADYPELPSNSILSLCLDKSGKLWVGTRLGLCFWQPENKTFKLVTLDGQLDKESITSLYIDKQERIYIGTHDKGLLICDKNLNVTQKLTKESTPALSDNAISCIFEDSHQQIWIGTDMKGLNKWNPDKQTVSAFFEHNSGLTDNYIRCLQEQNQQLIIGTFDGLSILNLTDDSITKYNKFEANRNNLSHFSVRSLCVDRAGTLWVGTYSGGVNYYNPLNNRFVFYHPLGNSEQKLYNIFGPMVYSTGSLWIATEGGGLLQFNPATKEYTNYLLEERPVGMHNKNIIKSLMIERESIWCGTNNGGLYRFHIPTKRFSLIHQFNEKNLGIYSIYRDSNEDIWLGTTSRQGLVRITKDKKITRKFPIGEKGETISFSSIRAFLPLRKNVYLIGTRSFGLYEYDVEKKTLIQYSTEEKDPSRQLENNYVTSILRKKNGEIWISTFGAGIYQYQEGKGIVRHIGTEEGLTNEEVYTLIEYNQNIWASIDNGIAEINTKTGQVHVYDCFAGLETLEFTPQGGICLPNGEVYFSGSNGFLSFAPRSLIKNNMMPPVVLTQLTVNNKVIQPGDQSHLLDANPDDTETITLAYNQNNFSIAYCALNYILHEQNQYAYKLVGHDEDWNHVGTRKEAYYTNIAPGKYIFHVIASNNDDVWNTQGKTLEIIILSPWWKTPWAYMIYALLFIGITYTIGYYMYSKHKLELNLRMRQMEKQRMEEFHQTKIRLFTNFSHELRTPLTLIISPIDELVRQAEVPHFIKTKLDLVLKNARRLLLLVNQLMDLQKNQSGSLTLSLTHTDLNAFLLEIYYTFKQIAESKQITFLYEAPEGEIPACFDQSLLEKAVFNLLSNAFKFTPPGETVTLRFIAALNKESLQQRFGKNISTDPTFVLSDDSNNYFVIQVADTGKGIPETARTHIFDPFYQVSAPQTANDNVNGTGIGLSLTQSVVHLHQGAISVDSNRPKGSIFTIILPNNEQPESMEENVINNLSENEREEQEVVSQSEESAEELPYLTGKTILLVEDNEDIRSYVKEHLQRHYRVLEAGNGEEAFQIVLKEFPDLVVTDIMMPGVDGLELCAMIKNDLQTGHIPVILLTARTMVMHVKEGFLSGADDYVVKPFNIDVLLVRIYNLLLQREKLKSMYGKNFSLQSMGIETTSADDKFMQKLFEIIQDHLDNPDLKVDMICDEMGFSRSNFYRKLKAVTDLSLNDLIRHKRLEVAAQLLKKADMNVTEVSIATGFSTLAYFTKCFKSAYGVSPTEYVKGQPEE